MYSRGLEFRDEIVKCQKVREGMGCVQGKGYLAKVARCRRMAIVTSDSCRLPNGAYWCNLIHKQIAASNHNIALFI